MDTKPEGLSVSESEEIFRSLSLGGVKGKVRATLSQQQLSFESRNGHALDLKLDGIQRVHQHHTTLIPGWLGIVGLILIWIAWRGVNEAPQALLGAAGLVLLGAHIITRRPTLTIDTFVGDCHTVFGNDSSLMRLCIMVQKMQNGETLEEARKGYDNMIHDSDYPRTTLLQEALLIPKPIKLEPSPVLDSFLNSMDFEISDVLSAEIVEEPEESVADLVLPDWYDEIGDPEPEIPSGLMSRAQSNLHTQRHNVVQNGWQPSLQQHPHSVHRNTMIDASSFGMMNHHGVAPSHSVPMQHSPLPTNFLPSFMGADGAHIPSTNPEMFSSPDTPLFEAEIVEPTPSLVAASRKNEAIIESDVVEEEKIETPTERYPAFSRFSSKPEKRRLTTRKKRGGMLSGRYVMRELVAPSLERASAISRRLLRRNRTGDALRIQANNARQSQVAESIRNLAQSRGGAVSDDEVQEMMSHIIPEPEIPASFGELVSTEGTRRKGDGVCSLPRLDL